MKKNSKPLVILKILLGTYILFCLIIAGLNYGVAPGASEDTARLISSAWHLYENEFKTILIITASILSLMLIRKNESNKMRRRNYTGFILAALLIHVAGPIITGTRELYFLSMPVPWSSFSIQLFDSSTGFHQNFTSHWGAAGLGGLLIFVILYNVFIFAGTLLFGRRLQCSQLCLFNGFAAEVFASAFPLTGGKAKQAGKKLKKVFRIARVIMLAIAIFFTLAAALSAAGLIKIEGRLLYDIEVYKYLSVELLMAMFFWIVLTGRGYCNYCPAGTVLAVVSKAAKQQIRTDLTKCIECRKCDRSCPMSIDISSRAAEGLPVKSLDCVGCGHCVDVCPVDTLVYSTGFLTLFGRLRKKNAGHSQ